MSSRGEIQYCYARAKGHHSSRSESHSVSYNPWNPISYWDVTEERQREGGGLSAHSLQRVSEHSPPSTPQRGHLSGEVDLLSFMALTFPSALNSHISREYPPFLAFTSFTTYTYLQGYFINVSLPLQSVCSMSTGLASK